jgi:hypothetical protein
MLIRLFTLFSCLYFSQLLHSQTSNQAQLFDFPFDNNINDHSQNSFVGIPTGALTSTEDRFGNSCSAMQFQNGSFFSIENNSAFDGIAGSFSLSVWFKPTKAVNQANEICIPIISKGDVATKGSIDIQYIQSFQNASATVVFTNDFSGEDKTYSTHRLEFDKWYFFAITFDEGWVQAYLNGKMIWLSMYNKLVVRNSSPFSIGKNLAGNKFFNGALDDLKVYKRGLSAFEVSQLYADVSGKSKKNVFELKTSEDITVEANPGKCFTNVKYAKPTVEITCGSAKIIQLSGPESGSVFNVGLTSIKFEASTEAGRTQSGSFNVIVKDVEIPVLVCPEDVSVIAPPNSTGVEVAYSDVVATDNCPNLKVKLESGFESDKFFPMGTTLVKYSATDMSNNRAECSFKVTVREDLNPITRCNSDIVLYTPRDRDFAIASYPVPEFQIKGKKTAMLLVRGPAVGAQLKPGTHTVFYALGNTEVGEVNCEFNIVVKDTITPAIKCASDVKATAIGEDKTAVVNYIIPTATDGGKPVVVKLIEGLGSGQKFPVGVTVVKYEATDAAGNSSTCDFVVRVEGAKPLPNAVKAINCIADITMANEPGKPGAVVTFDLPAAIGGENVKITQTKGLPSGSFFSIGTTLNAFSATDILGNIRDCSFNVKITDKEPPVFVCPTDSIVILPRDRRGLIYNYNPIKVSDNGKVDSVIQTEGSKTGCFLQLGEHPFSFTAKDASGNTSTCSFVVSVRTDNSTETVLIPSKLDKALNMGADSIHYEHTAVLNSCLLTAIIYDDGEEDGDSVSIVFNGQILVDRDGIRVKENGVIKRYLVLSGNNENYIAAKAWNTGRYGLNTLRIDIYEGYIENEKKEMKNKKPVFSKVLHSKPGSAGGIILSCKW